MYPKYIQTTCLIANKKKLIIGINTNFEIKLLIIDEKGRFVELNRTTIINFLLAIDGSYSSFDGDNDRRKIYWLKKNFSLDGESNMLFKCTINDNLIKVSLHDKLNKKKIFFCSNDWHELFQVKNVLHMKFSKLNFHLTAIVNFYKHYIKILMNKGSLKFDYFDYVQVKTENRNFYSIDFLELAEEFSVFPKEKIQRDIDLSCVTMSVY